MFFSHPQPAGTKQQCDTHAEQVIAILYVGVIENVCFDLGCPVQSAIHIWKSSYLCIVMSSQLWI